MREFRCGDLVPECEAVLHGEADDDLFAKVEVHAREAHGMDHIPPDVADTIHESFSEGR